MHVKEVKIVGLRELESVQIGANCFTEQPDSYDSTPNGSFIVRDCPKLKRLAIGRESCVNWTSFVVKNCTAIQEVSIGDGCFVHCENTVFEGTYRRME